MIRAIYRKGAIEPLDDLPADWHEGQELVVDALPGADTTESFEEWAAEIKTAAAGISDEDHDRLMAALADIESESKELGRREMERSRNIFADDPDAAASKAAG